MKVRGKQDGRKGVSLYHGVVVVGLAIDEHGGEEMAVGGFEAWARRRSYLGVAWGHVMGAWLPAAWPMPTHPTACNMCMQQARNVFRKSYASMTWRFSIGCLSARRYGLAAEKHVQSALRRSRKPR